MRRHLSYIFLAAVLAVPASGQESLPGGLSDYTMELVLDESGVRLHGALTGQVFVQNHSDRAREFPGTLRVDRVHGLGFEIELPGGQVEVVRGTDSSHIGAPTGPVTFEPGERLIIPLYLLSAPSVARRFVCAEPGTHRIRAVYDMGDVGIDESVYQEMVAQGLAVEGRYNAPQQTEISSEWHEFEVSESGPGFETWTALVSDRFALQTFAVPEVAYELRYGLKELMTYRREGEKCLVYQLYGDRLLPALRFPPYNDVAALEAARQLLGVAKGAGVGVEMTKWICRYLELAAENEGGQGCEQLARLVGPERYLFE
ncbi:MAG: hypothetical protein KDA57_19645 [Planctomycetales bacterium]|nr:hypothetical protein [Planctomycetales bacterium]